MPAKVITHGTGPVLRDWNFLESVSGPDEVTFLAQNCPERTTYAKGMQVPGYSACRIVETRARLVPGSQYDIQVRARGLISGSSRVVARRESSSAEGWDDLTERRMETAATTVPTFGQPHPNHPKMFYMAGGNEHTLDLGDGTSYWVTRDRSYRGMLAAVTKQVSRKVTVNENIVSPSDPIVVTFPGGWPDARNAQVSFPRVVVEDTVVTLVAPPTGNLPGAYTPIDPPIIQSISITGSDLTWNWPHGWKLASIASTELFRGAGVYHQTIVYEYVWPAQF